MPLSLKRCLALSLVCAPLVVAAESADHAHNKATPYAGLEDRHIKSLSEKDIAELRRGAGWGLALPAELNGLPGPAHLLELRTELGLNPKQVEEITDLFKEMQREAIAAGERFIAAEAAVSEAFAARTLSEPDLRALLEASAEARAELRHIHLSRHLATPALLTDEQIAKYQVLRGYAEDPCASVPDGHNADLWRRHNGCD